MSLVLAISTVLMADARPPAEPCVPIPGFEAVAADGEVRWIVIGEGHGTNEIPAMFADAVCLAAVSRPVVVALEQPSADQPAIDAFLKSDGGDAAQAAFLRASMWNMGSKDGRSSEAMFRLFETLRRMHATGEVAEVVAFQPNLLANVTTREEAEKVMAAFNQADYEKAMAATVAGAARPGAVVLVLTGGLHARRTELPGGPRFVGMAGHLPPEATLTFNTVSNGGESWACEGRPDTCGVKPYLNEGNGRPRGAQIGSDDPGYSGLIYLGTEISASPPQPAPDSTG